MKIYVIIQLRIFTIKIKNNLTMCEYYNVNDNMWK